MKIEPFLVKPWLEDGGLTEKMNMKEMIKNKTPTSGLFYTASSPDSDCGVSKSEGCYICAQGIAGLRAGTCYPDQLNCRGGWTVEPRYDHNITRQIVYPTSFLFCTGVERHSAASFGV